MNKAQDKWDLIKDIWKHYKQAYDWLGIQHLKALLNQLEKRDKKAAQTLMHPYVFSDEATQRVQQSGFYVITHLDVLNQMIQQYNDTGTVSHSTNETLVKLTPTPFQNKGRPLKYDHAKLTYPVWLEMKREHGKSVPRSKIVDAVIENHNENRSYPDRQLIEREIKRYEETGYFPRK